MKKTLMAVALAAVAFAGGAQAAPKTRANTVMIPFNFRVQNVELPAGEYRVRRVGMGFALVENVETRQTVHVLRDNGYDSSKKKLIFKEVGGEKVLERVS
jgi:hypothetical protein